MLNLDHVTQLLSKLPIRHRDTGATVPFVFNFNQRRAVAKYEKWLASEGLFRIICVKSRRVGFSKLSDGILFAHCLALPNAHALIVAHDFKTSVDLFRDPLAWVKALPFSLPLPTQRKIRLPHPQGESVLDIATAGNIAGGHGMTLSALHLSEAARYPGQDSFTSLLPTVSDNDPNSVIIIESTANGQVGQGEVFYQYWKAACEGENGYLPVFLGWLEDPACVRDPAEAEDAPADEIERELMRAPYRATKAQVAWYRYILESKCHGLPDVFLEQYPYTSDVAFVVSGDPAFTRSELSYMRETQCEPLAVGHITCDLSAPPRFERARGGWHIYEFPDGKSWYYIGADAARGVEHGDFAAACVWNGHTGALAARYQERIDPETLAAVLNAAGRFYRANQHVALINVELTGNLGLWTQKLLRDQFHYPNLYIWKGRDDRKPNTGARTALGWETSFRTRERMFAIFRAALAHHRIQPRDKLLIDQCHFALRSAHVFDFEVKKGHDDVLMAALIGWVSVADYPPPPHAPVGRKPWGVSSEEDERKRLHYLDDAATMLKRHLETVESATRRKHQVDRLGEL